MHDYHSSRADLKLNGPSNGNLIKFSEYNHLPEQLWNYLLGEDAIFFHDCLILTIAGEQLTE